MAKKLPFMTLFTGDWTRDTRVLSMEARALWIDLLCLMWDGDRRGYLSRGGQPFLAEDVARHCGCPVEVVERGFAELLRLGVASKDDTGTIYSRRIVRDDKRRRTNAANGRRGGNPTLKGSVNKSVNLPDENTDKAPLEYGNGDGIGIVSSAAGGGGVGAGGRKRFVPPTVAEVAAYCAERQNCVNPETFVNHYISNGWMVGKNRMRNWKAAVCTWENSNFADKKAAPTAGPSGGEAWSAAIAVARRWGSKLWRRDPRPGEWDERMRARYDAETAAMESDLNALPPLARKAAENLGWRLLVDTKESFVVGRFMDEFNALAARKTTS